MPTLTPATETTLHIFVLQDTREDFEMIESELQRAGLSFRSTRIDEAEALSRELARESPHVVLCDHRSTRIDSFRALETVRARSRTLPFIVVTGPLPEAQMTEAFTRGADDLVLKHRLGDLGPAVQRALRLSETRRQLAEAEDERDRLRAELEAWRFGHPRMPTALPICAGCKKIRQTNNDWIQLESYLRDHFNIRFSHGICLDCLKTYSARGD